MKWSALYGSGSRCLTVCDRAGVYARCDPPAEPFWHCLFADRRDGEQLLEHPVESIPSLLHEFRDDFYLDEQAVRAALTAPDQFNAIDKRSAFKIAFWMLRSAPFEMSVFQRRLSVHLLGEQSWISTAEDVILHKLYWDSLTRSERQVADAAGVIAVQSVSLDRAYLEKWSGELGISEKPNKLLTGEIKPKST